MGKVIGLTFPARKRGGSKPPEGTQSEDPKPEDTKPEDNKPEG